LHFSSLDTSKSKLPKLQLHKKIEKNLSFIKNLGLETSDSNENFVVSERFNCYMRDVFSKLYSNKKLQKEQDFSYRSKNYHTEISTTNIIEKKVPAKKFNLKYFIGTKGQAINVVTSRLETIF
jgi:valyl-tRNA synthetase